MVNKNNKTTLILTRMLFIRRLILIVIQVNHINVIDIAIVVITIVRILIHVFMYLVVSCLFLLQQ